ncbi:MAG: SufD family Fe-S cluster assembly protein [Candidatus Micrarchaeaceae archaeon]
MSLYESLVKESRELYKSLPDESNELFKRRYVPIDLYGYGARKNPANISNDPNKLPLRFDALISPSSCISNSKFIQIFDAGTEEYMSLLKSRSYNTNSDKYASFVNAESSKAVLVEPESNSERKLNIFVSTGSDMCIQVFIKEPEGSNTEITEWFSSSEQEGGIIGIINEAVAGQNSDLSINVVHNEPKRAKILNFSSALAMESASINVNYMYLGGEATKSKNLLTANGRYSSVAANELVMGQEDQKFDINTSILNEASLSNANLASKAIVSDRSVCFLKGFSKIINGAKDSRSFVEERGLLIDKSAKIESIPSMSIDEGQVKASHSSAMAPLDEDMIFYLTSRGITRLSARSLIINGFILSQLSKIKNEMLKVALSSIITSRSIGSSGIGELPKETPGYFWIPSESHGTISKHNYIK